MRCTSFRLLSAYMDSAGRGGRVRDSGRKPGDMPANVDVLAAIFDGLTVLRL